MSNFTRAEGVLANDTDVDSGESALLVVSTFGTATDGTGNDAGDALSIGDATFSLSTTGTWSFDPGTEYDDLALGDSTSETFYYTVEDPDGATDIGALTITITGLNNPSIITGTFTGDVFEDNILSVTGNLIISDIDTSDNPNFNDVVSTIGNNGYGSFELINGTWTYILDNNNISVQALDTDETLTDSVTFTATDGNSQIITITINGEDESTLTINKSQKDKLNFYPNPVSNFIIINGLKQKEIITIFNISGQKLFARPLSKTNNQLDVSHLSEGVYIIKINSSKLKFIKH